jgi:pilus assembly protein Flp/PilA
MMKNIKRFFKNRSGSSAVEYGLLVALIAVTLTGGMGLLGTSINSAFAKPLDVLASSGSGGDNPGNVIPVVPGKKVPGKLMNPGVSLAR